MCSKFHGKIIDLLDEDGNLLNGTTGLLVAWCLYPDDTASREQAFHIYAVEGDRYYQDPQAYAPSELAQSVLTSYRKSVGQRCACALTMLAYQLLFMKGRDDVSLYEATKTVEKSLDIASNQGVSPMRQFIYEGGTWRWRNTRIPSNHKDIAKAFRKYFSVSHIVAAEALCSQIFEPEFVFERTFEMNAIVVNTASAFEQAMRRHAHEHFQDAWYVSANQTDEIISCGHAPFDGFFRQLLELGIRHREAKD